MLNKRATELIKDTKNDSFCLDLKKWLEVMRKFEEGLFMYHTTLPTDSLVIFRHMIDAYMKYGL
jgi:aspartate aminotransferase-like enzyme